LLIDSPDGVKVAVDGTDMVVAAIDAKYYFDYSYNGPVLLTFYSMNNDEEEWRMVQSPIAVHDVGDEIDVALSSETAFVGFRGFNDYDGIVYVYEKNQFGDWREMDEPFIHTNTTSSSYGSQFVAFDGDLACIRSRSLHDLYIYHREDSDKWVQLDTVDSGAGDCSISGDTVVIRDNDSELGSWFLKLYKYDKGTKELTLIQDPIPRNFGTAYLNGDYLVDLNQNGDDWEFDVVIYSRKECVPPTT